MKTNLADISEDILSEQYSSPSFLPPLWRVIFQEAMRGNHLIFCKSVQEKALSENFTSASDELVDLCATLFAAPDLKAIKTIISFLSKEEQLTLFFIYMNQMNVIKEENKSLRN